MSGCKIINEFLLKNPTFHQSYSDKYMFIGNLMVKEQFFHIQLRLPNFPKIKNMNGYISKGLDVYSLPEENDDLEINNFMFILGKYLNDIVESKYSVTKSIAEDIDNDINNLEMLLEEFKKLNTYNCKIFLNNQRTKIKFMDFEKYPGHYLELNISKRNCIQIINHSLPDCLFNNDTNPNSNLNAINEIFRHSNTLENFLMKFLQILEQLEEFYENMNTIDELCYVVEPNEITLKHNWRIFKLNEKNFIKITVDPLQSSSVVVNLIGPTNDIEKYREMYNDKSKNWDTDLDIHKNLLRIFNLMYFPMRNKCENNVHNEYCNICFIYTLDNHIPIISCDNPKCHLIFHVYCLKKWFAMLMDERKFLNVNFGTCPFCKEKLSKSFVQLLEIS